MSKIVVVTGASAGVGRATVREFAAHGYDVALLARHRGRLETAAEECRAFGVRALPLCVDVADSAAVENAAEQIEQVLGPIDVWVNIAMATAFSEFEHLTAEEFKRGTEVTYLGQVYGVMAALRRMRRRNRGTLINVGSALAHRAIPLQSVYCGAKFAVRGFTESLRSELIHDRLNVHVCTVDLPALNTPQFDWALNKTGWQSRPVAPVFEPELAARAIYFASQHRRRAIYVGTSTVKAMLANLLLPGLLDHYLAHSGYAGQMTRRRQAPDAPANLFATVDGTQGARGRFEAEAIHGQVATFSDRYRAAAWWGVGIGLWLAWRMLRDRRPTSTQH
ncbi:MAG TPA: SDR family oxidoreductase [Steroidobacteraceae bacterium]